jgi:serine/threonine-protein kinase
MVTGQLPFEAATPWQWATEHMTSRPRPFELSPAKDRIPPQMQAAILRALEKDREKRQPSARAFYLELTQGPQTQAATNVVVNTGAYGSSAASEVAEQHTAAMDAVPDFGAPGLQRTIDMPAAAARASAATPGGVVATQVPVATKGRGNKGLIWGLAGLAAALLVGTLVVALQSKKSEPDVALTNPFEQGAAASKAAIAPTVDSAEAPASAPPTAPEAAHDQAEPPKPPAAASEPRKPTAPSNPGTAKPPTPSGAPTVNPTPTPTPGKEPTPTKEPTAPKEAAPSGTDACLACVNAARSGNIPAAARSYSACSIPALQARCKETAQRSATSAAQTAAMNGNCKQAAAIAAAATAMGAMTPKLSDTVKMCK